MIYYPVKAATPQWQDDLPVSASHKDSYYCPEGGLSESRHVFLDGCQVDQQWRDRSQFCILETGFGIGLNLLATWQRWQQTRKPGQRLHLISVEAHPLTGEQMRRALSRWPELSSIAALLMEHLPEPVGGFHRRWFVSEQLSLTLLYGPADACLEALEAQVDAIYLDGFSPRCNADLWSPAVFAQLQRLARPGCRLSSFTSAGFVHSGLEEAGFSVTRVTGFGRKHDMIRAERRLDTPCRSRLPAWYRLPEPVDGHSIEILGSGIAGASVAQALELRGLSPRVVDPQPQRAASRNPVAVMAPKLPVQTNVGGQLLLSAALYARHAYQQSGALIANEALIAEHSRLNEDQCMALVANWQLPETLLQRLGADEMAVLSDDQIHHPGLKLGLGGSVDTRHLLSQWLPDIHSEPLNCGTHQILCLGAASLKRMPSLRAVMTASQGEVVLVDDCTLPHLHRPLCGQGQVARSNGQGWQVGSSFKPIPADQATDPQQPDPEVQREILDKLSPRPNSLDPSLPVLGGRVAVRLRSRDRLPMAGPLPDPEAYLAAFAGLPRSEQSVAQVIPPWMHGQWLLTGLGSHGYTYAPLLAELLVSQMLGEPWPLPRQVALTVQPARLIIRDLRRTDTQ